MCEESGSNHSQESGTLNDFSSNDFSFNDSGSKGRQYQVLCAPQPSRFTWRDFRCLNNSMESHSTPLAVIAHIDVNAFFAQAEMIRLGLSSKDPVVCVQWWSLIAVSYAARAYGINRMDTVASAKKKCPNVILAHTAVFKKGEPFWTYKEAGVLPSVLDHKVSLDPYRRESRKIMRIFRSECDKVQKASVDECFLDFGRLIFTKAIELFPILNDPKSMENLDDFLPPIPQVLPEWCEFKGEVIPSNGDEIGNENEIGIGESKDVHNNQRILTDWDDIFIMIGSKIAYQIRERIRKELGYTLSCGISRVKTVSKLASGFIKPNDQTIVRSSAIPIFLKNFEFTDFWSMGGKTGEIIRQKLMIPTDENSIEYILKNFSLKELQLKLKPDTALATRLYSMAKGEAYDMLDLKTDVKSMCSTKNFRGKSLSSKEDLYEWMKVFTSDLMQRLTELDEEEGIFNSENLNNNNNNNITKACTIRRPKTMSVHYKSAKYRMVSKQCQLPLVASIERLNEIVYQTGCKLVNQLVETWDNTTLGEMFPSVNASLTISSFENINFKSKSIDEFFHIKGDKAKSERKDEAINLMFNEIKNDNTSTNNKPIKKDNKVEMDKTLTTNNNNKHIDIFQSLAKKNLKDNTIQEPISLTDEDDENRKENNEYPPNYCAECQKIISKDQTAEHDDFHYALNLSKKWNEESNTTPTNNRDNEQNLNNDPTGSSSKQLYRSRKKKKLDKGQSTLPF